MRVIGLMSGTSADGVDVALCDITGTPDALSASIVAARTYPYDAPLRERIFACCDREASRVDAIAQLHVDLAERFARAIHDLLETEAVPLARVDLIGSHGQTVWHNVLPDGSVSATFQIGEPAILAERTGLTTISNFRARDVAAGGQGAPLTGYVDWLLLRHPTKWRAIQNIGGMGNVTFLPPRSVEDVQPITFDTGPGNALIDAAMAHFTDGAKPYDFRGEYAQQGRPDTDWLEVLLQHPYFERDIPKTTGRELFGSEAAQRMIAEAAQRGIAPHDVVHTLTALTALTIARAYQRFAPAPIEEVILGGGGRHNLTLLEMLHTRLHPATVMAHEQVGINSDFKEALVFAVLAYETWHGRAGTLPTLTGAEHATILGDITPGANFEALLRERLKP